VFETCSITERPKSPSKTRFVGGEGGTIALLQKRSQKPNEVVLLLPLI